MRAEGLRWLIRTALLGLPSRDRWGVQTPEWVPAALAVAAMLSGFLLVTMSIGLPAAAQWVALGLSIVVVAAGVALCLIRVTHNRVALAGAGLMLATLAVWTIVASAGTLQTAVVRWVVMGSGIGYVVESLIALLAHELAPRRIVHVLEVREVTEAR